MRARPLARAALALAALVLSTGCVSYDLAAAPSKDLAVGHIYERLPLAVKVARFRDRTGEETPLSSRILARCTDSFLTSLRRTDVFERVTSQGGDRVDLGLEGEVERFECTQNYACVWCFYSVFALIAVPANLPLSVDDAVYEVSLRAVVPQTGKVLATYRTRVHLRSWRGAWSLFETWLDDPGQVFDRANQALLGQLVDDYARYRALALVPPPIPPGEDK